MDVAYEPYLGEILIDAEAVQRRVAELAHRISDDYRGKMPLLVCILKGGIVFLVDLIKRIDIPHSVDFMAVSSYGAGARGGGRGGPAGRGERQPRARGGRRA